MLSWFLLLLLALTSNSHPVQFHTNATLPPDFLNRTEFGPEFGDEERAGLFREMQSDFCDESSCLGLCGSHNVQCWCDHLCQTFGDCCYDYWALNCDAEEYSHPNHSVVATAPPTFTCRNLADLRIPALGAFARYSPVVDKCPAAFPGTRGTNLVTARCHMDTSASHANLYQLLLNNSQTFLDVDPVSDERGVIYKNIYCAICNDADLSRLNYFRADFECPPEFYFTVDKPMKVLLENCRLAFPLDVPARYCKHDVINSLQSGSSEEIAMAVNRDSYCGKYRFPLTVAVWNATGDQQNMTRGYSSDCLAEYMQVPVAEMSHRYRMWSDCLIGRSGGGGLGRGGGGGFGLSDLDSTLDNYRVRASLQLRYNSTIYPELRVKAVTWREIEGFADICDRDPTCVEFLIRKIEISDPRGKPHIGVTISNVALIVLSKILLTVAVALVADDHLTKLRRFPMLKGYSRVVTLEFLISLWLVYAGMVVMLAIPLGACVHWAPWLHYLLLSSFFWMTSLGIDMQRNFTSMTSFNDRTRTHLFIFNCISWLVPLPITMGAYLNDQWLHWIPRLYDPLTCWIAEPAFHLISFAVPLVSCLALNVISYLRIIGAIHSNTIQPGKDENPDSDSKKSRSHVIFLKLSLILGGNWALGYVALIIDQDPVWSVWQVLNALSGAMVASFFILTVYRKRRQVNNTST